MRGSAIKLTERDSPTTLLKIFRIRKQGAAKVIIENYKKRRYLESGKFFLRKKPLTQAVKRDSFIISYPKIRNFVDP